MRVTLVSALGAFTLAAACVVAACSSDPSETTPGGNDEAGAGDDGGPGTGDGGPGPTDASRQDGDTNLDGAIVDDGGVIDGGDPPSVQMIGRFEPDGANARFAFPGSKLVVRFNGTGATVKLTQTSGFSPGNSWFNVSVDGVPQAPLEVVGASVDYPVATNLPAGAHTVVLEKRTEANRGVVTYEGFTFAGGGTLLGPPARPTRRIEFLSDSTIDGFGIEGDRNVTCTGGTAPAQYDNAGKSMAMVAASGVSAEPYLIAYSGKGITANAAGPSDALMFSTLYNRALPDVASSAWGFGWVPDAVVISLGGVDFDGQTTVPANFVASYGALVDAIRGHYPNAWIFMTVWSQIKDDNGPTRTAMKGALDQVVAARAADAKLSVFLFPQANVNTDETGCQYHGNVTHHAAMATALDNELKAKLAW